jgi:precorrin-4 methylase
VARQISQVIVLFCLFGTPALAQGTRPPTADEIVVLHQAGLPEAELGSVLDRNGIPALSTADLARLAEAGVPEPVMARLRGAAAKAQKANVSLDEIVKMASSGVPEDAVIDTIQGSNNGFAITAEQWLDLVRRGISANVLKALRNKTGAARGAETRAKAIKLEDLTKLQAEGITAGEIVQRIRANDCTFDVSVDQLIVLSRQGVSKEVLKEVWARRANTSPATTNAADPAIPVSASSRPAEPSQAALSLHVESGGNFSLLVPSVFRTTRETRGANALVSFLLGEADKTTGLSEAELSVFRYRSSTPDRLTEANLPAIANNFLASLQASYAKRHLTVNFGERQPAKAAGQPALEAKVVTSAADGTTHQGRILITYAEDQIFVVSTAIRTDRQEQHGVALERCLRSFGLLTRKAKPTNGTSDDEKLLALAHAWRDAVLNRDWSLYDSLFQTAGATERRREQFVATCDRFAVPGRRLVLGPVVATQDGGKVQYRIIPSDPPESFDVGWIRDGQTFALAE